MSPRHRSRCHQFVNGFSNLNFFDPDHSDLKILLFLDKPQF